jgi:phosphate transport system permease protein
LKSNPLPGSNADQIADGTAALLIIMVLVFNLLLALPSRWLQYRLTGKNK